ncbi:MAG: transketolase C-terminal domain-containing protein [bacterium]|nr:transketolase C-terminal domain-containing protein [bacterium]
MIRVKTRVSREIHESPTKGMFTMEELSTLVAVVRKGVFEICLTANHGHIGGSSSAVELFVALYFGGILRFNPNDPDDHARDRILVRGHLGPLRYKIFSLLGWLDEKELLTYRRIGSRLHGHEDHIETPGVDVTPSGSLGMLLSYGVGTSLGARNAGDFFRTFVFLGDGEEQEGMVSEAARHAAHLQLGNLFAIIDRNGKQLSNPTADTDSATLVTVWRGYGWRVITLPEGHNIGHILSAYKQALVTAQMTGKPTLIIADTIKGFGLDGAIKHFSGYHTMSRVKNEVVQDAIRTLEDNLNPQLVREVLEKLNVLRKIFLKSTTVDPWISVSLDINPSPDTPNHPDNCQFDYFRDLHKATKEGVLSRPNLYFLTADVTTVEVVASLELDQTFHFYNVGIREQHMIAMAHGLTVTYPHTRVLINSFDAFTYRGIDQINAALQGYGRMVIIGDVAGITNSQNGKTHQTTGLPAALLSMEGLTFLEPWDAIDTFACLNWALGENRRITYIRVYSALVTQQPTFITPRTITYYVVRETHRDPDIVLVGAGLTVNSCLEAANHLQAIGIETRVINVVNPNSLDEGFGALVANGRPLLTVYNGHPRVLRQAVADALFLGRAHPSTLKGLGFTVGNTGTLAEMQTWTGLSADGIYKTSLSLL